MSSRRPVAESGLTLAELVVATAIFTIMTTLVWGTMHAQNKTFGRESARSMRTSDMRVWLERMVLDIRRAGYDPRDTNTDTTRTFAITWAGDTHLELTVDEDRDGVLDSGSRENRGYQLSGGELQQFQGGSTWRTVVDGVQSLDFDYFDTSRTPISSPNNSLNTIAEVEVTITARADDPTGPVAEAPLVTRTARAKLRNLP